MRLRRPCFDANVPSLGLPSRSEGFGLLPDGSEGQTHLVSAGPEADSLAAAIGVEKVPQPLEPTFGAGGGEEAGPGGVVIHVALGPAIGQGSGGCVLVLHADGDFRSGVVAGEHGHGPAQHVRGDLAGRDLGKTGDSPVTVDVLDEACDSGLAGKAIAVEARSDPREGEGVVHRQVHGGFDGLRNRCDDPPVGAGQVGIELAFDRLHCWDAEVLGESIFGDLAVTHRCWARARRRDGQGGGVEVDWSAGAVSTAPAAPAALNSRTAPRLRANCVRCLLVFDHPNKACPFWPCLPEDRRAGRCCSCRS